MLKNNFNTMSLRELGKQWLYFNKQSLKKSTLQTYTVHFENHIAQSELANCHPKDIEPEGIIRFSQKLLDKNLSPKTVNCILLVLHSIFKFAKTMYGFSPPHIQYIKERKKETRVLSSEEQCRLEQHLKSDLNIHRSEGWRTLCLKMGGHPRRHSKNQQDNAPNQRRKRPQRSHTRRAKNSEFLPYYTAPGFYEPNH